MDKIVEEILKKLPQSITILFLFLIFLYLILFPEKVIYIKSQIAYLFLWMGTRVKKKQIENEIKANILRVAKKASKDIQDALPYDIKIKWLSETDRESFINGNTVIVRMDNKKTKSQNIVFTLHDYVNKSLLYKERPYIDDILYKSSNLVMTRKLLVDCYQSGFSSFFTDILQAEISNNESLKSAIEKLIRIDEDGLFVQVLLRQIKCMCKRVYGSIEPTLFIQETISFVDFLYEVAMHKVGDDTTNLKFAGEYYKVSIVIIAKAFTYEEYGEEAYIKRIRQNYREGCTSIYLTARNKRIRTLDRVVKKLNPDIIYEKNKFKYKGRSIKGYTFDGVCIELNMKPLTKREFSDTL